MRVQYSGRSFDASWPRSATLIVPGWTSVLLAARVPKSSVRNGHSGSLSIADADADEAAAAPEVLLELRLPGIVEHVGGRVEEDDHAVLGEVLLRQLGRIVRRDDAKRRSRPSVRNARIGRRVRRSGARPPGS